MDIVIVLIGLSIACAGVVLSWHQKGAGVWATYVFGFLLVLTGGPLRQNLTTLSVTGQGLEVEFTVTEPSEIQVKEIEDRARASILSLSAAESNVVSTEGRKLLDDASQDVVDQLLPFIRSIGFVPTQIVGAEQMRPGSVVTISDGRPITWATPSEAFPDLDTVSSNVPFPTFEIESSLPGSTNADSKLLVRFDCKEGAQNVEASLSALSSKGNKDLLARIGNNTTMYVVQSVLLCKNLFLASSSRDTAESSEEQKNFLYSATEPVVLGYRLANLSFQGQ